MINVVREKQTFCGAEYKEIDIYPASVRKVCGRSERKNVSSDKQKNLNDKMARRKLVQIINTNFRDYEDYLLHLTYDEEHLPATVEEAELICRNYIRRLNYKLRKLGKKNCKYITITSDTSTKTGKLVRIHHHIILQCELPEKEILAAWEYGRRNMNELQGRTDRYNALAEYLRKNVGGKKRWISSRGLKKPTEQTNDRKFSRRQIEKIAKAPLDTDFWEKKYPGWTLIGSETAYEAAYNDITGWSLCLKLRRKRRQEWTGRKRH